MWIKFLGHLWMGVKTCPLGAQKWAKCLSVNVFFYHSMLFRVYCKTRNSNFFALGPKIVEIGQFFKLILLFSIFSIDAESTENLNILSVHRKIFKCLQRIRRKHLAVYQRIHRKYWSKHDEYNKVKNVSWVLCDTQNCLRTCGNYLNLSGEYAESKKVLKGIWRKMPNESCSILLIRQET